MASQCFFCIQCNRKYPTHQTLFDTLYNFQKMAPEDCSACGGTRELRLTLDFQLGTGDGEFKVVSAFLPEKLESWLGEEEEEVTFYPFLVVLHRTSDSKEFCWMPYWHVRGKDAKFGQHAVCLDHAEFESLIAQARETALGRV
jgi:hypothetical protein